VCISNCAATSAVAGSSLSIYPSTKNPPDRWLHGIITRSGNKAWKDCDRRNQYQRAYRLKLGMKPRIPRQRERTDCVVCGQPIGRNSSRFCGIQCQRKSEHTQFVNKWLRGEVLGGNAAGVWRHIRRYLLAQGGEQCSRCGCSEKHPITGHVPLEVGHLNGNYADNSPETCGCSAQIATHLHRRSGA